MAEHPEFAELYQDTYTQYKLDKEVDRDRVMRVHERFERIADTDNLVGKVTDDEIDNPMGTTDEEEAYESTDIEDWNNIGLGQVYVRYKVLKSTMKKEEMDIKKEIESATKRFRADLIGDKDSVMTERPFRDTLNRLTTSL